MCPCKCVLIRNATYGNHKNLFASKCSNVTIILVATSYSYVYRRLITIAYRLFNNSEAQRDMCMMHQSHTHTEQLLVAIRKESLVLADISNMHDF